LTPLRRPSSRPPRRGDGAGSTFFSGFFSGFSRQITSTFPICCTGSACSRAQISPIHASRAFLSSVAARTLMSSCAFSARSISATTSAVRPLSPMITTGFSLCACARNSLRRDDVSGMGAV